MSLLTALSLTELRERRSAKWRTYEPDVLPLWVAEMDTPLAPPVAEALAAAVARGDTGYVWPGALAEAYADFAGARLGWAPDPALSLLVPDVMRGIVEVLGVVTEPGDGVVVNPPVYPPFFSFLREARRRVVEVPLAEVRGGAYRLDLAGLEAAFAAGAARAYLLCNPHNPTGTVFPREDLLAVAGLAQRYGVRLLADEIHAPLAYPGTAAVPLLSLAAEAESAARGFAFGSTSKSWNLPGLKAALVFAGPAAGADLRAISPDVPLSAGLLGVVAGEAALWEARSWLDELVAALDANRMLLAGLVAEHLPGVAYRPPDATYLAWLNCRGTGLGDDPAAPFLDRARVAVNPGPAFGGPGRGFVRLNFATSPEILGEAVRRMATALGAAVSPRR
ncbi:MAG TPA: aminotransferase class I/II-fold pyridoxal phosphate-dependent enzyme [Micromonosporaceae bacterium]|nr:aminotransferase class I/II-fold pyridoxal phosphate-dependent enzyme [Micromonosporaceae bacterium]